MLIAKDIFKEASVNSVGSDSVPRHHVVRVVEALCEASNNELAELKRRIVQLERELYAQN